MLGSFGKDNAEKALVHRRNVYKLLTLTIIKRKEKK